MDELLVDPLGPIWMRPLDYSIAVSGSAFDVATKTAPRIYRRHTEREKWVEVNTAKQKLFGA
jgi:hypothetical protein